MGAVNERGGARVLTVKAADAASANRVVGQGDGFRLVERILVVNVHALRLSNQVGVRPYVTENDVALRRDLLPDLAVVNGAHAKVGGNGSAAESHVVLEDVAHDVVITHTVVTADVQD